MARNKVAAFLYLALAVAGCKQQATQPETVKYVRCNRAGIEDSLLIYFRSREREPRLVINNVDEDQTRVSFANHTLQWLNTEKETKIKIDNDLISLKKVFTLNKVAYGDAGEVGFVNNWDQINYYARNDSEEELVIIRMGYNPCTGMGCSVNYFLVYDLRRKVKNFFGTFRSDPEISLYDFGRGASLPSGYYYVSKSYVEELPRQEAQVSVTYELFALTKDGKFLLQKDTGGQPYYIKHTFSEADTVAVREALGVHWFEKLN